jgi:hypothetical protein
MVINCAAFLGNGMAEEVLRESFGIIQASIEKNTGVTRPESSDELTQDYTELIQNNARKLKYGLAY